MHILSPRWLVPGLRYQWNGVENLRHFAKILSKFSRDCDNFQAPFYTRTSLNYIKICFSPTNCGNVSFKIMHIVVKIWDWANSILQFKIKLERLWNSTLRLRKLRVNWEKSPFCLLDVWVPDLGSQQSKFLSALFWANLNYTLLSKQFISKL